MKGIIGKFPSPVIPQKHIKQMKPPGYNRPTLAITVAYIHLYGIFLWINRDLV